MVKKSSRKNNRKSRKHTEKSSKMNYTIENMYNDYLQQKDNLLEIGRGAQGTVYYNKFNNKSVYKISSSLENCRKWDIEVNKYKIINSFDIDTSNIKLLKMKHYLLDETSETCILELNRVINPLDIDANYTIQPLFGEMSKDYMYKGRGYFLGLNNLIEKDILTEDEIILIISQLGIVMSRLHYLVRIDCFDIELFLGIENNKKIVYIGDFDLSNFIINNYNEEEKQKILDSLTLVEYFPIYDETPELFDIFSRHYIEEATKLDKEEVAIEIIDRYRDY